MTSAPDTHARHGARWVAALLVSGVGLVGLGYSLATRPTPAPASVVFVPEPAEPRTGALASGSEALAAPPGPTTQSARIAEGTTSVAGTTPAAGLLIDLNTAPAEQLELLPGIGPARAAAIIADRQAMGPFRTVDDLQRIRGIGPATVESLRPYVSLGPIGSASAGG